MGNFYSQNKTKFNSHNITHVCTDVLSPLNLDKLKEINKSYKIINVPYFCESLIRFKMYDDDYFKKNPKKMVVVSNMIDYCLSNPDKTDEDANIFKHKMDYICNEQEGVCICNENANYFRKVYSQKKYDEFDNIICWIK